MKRPHRLALTALALVLACGAYLALQYLAGNVHEVIAGEFYRSGQLSGEGFTSVIERYRIRTVLNLRGESPRQWYKDEIAATEHLGVRHIGCRRSGN